MDMPDIEKKLAQEARKKRNAAERPIGRVIPAKNKQPAPIQITAEQLLREANDFKEVPFKPPSYRIEDQEDLDDYRMKKRTEFESQISRQRDNIAVWVRYATWEAAQKQMDRARSVFERALEVDYRNITLWLRYATMEMQNKYINHARNIWDRAVGLLPRVDQLWFKYAYMEEQLDNIAGARQVFERWMKWQPGPKAWNAYVNLEKRHQNPDAVRAIFERYILCHPEENTYLKYAKYETRAGEPSLARVVYERAIDELEEISCKLYTTFAKFEEEQAETERARVIYRYALDNVPKHEAEQMYQIYTAFEKQFGDRLGVEEVILSKRRFQYEEDVAATPFNYDAWFDYIRLEENAGDVEKTREIYQRAIANVPPRNEKRYWQRYIYLWINFAVFEELQAKDSARALQVYEKCLELIPHKEFTFAKVWLMLARLHIRLKDLSSARKVLGKSIGMCPKEKIFKEYIELELKLGNMDRCRKLYEKYLENAPENCVAWSKFAEMEASLAEYERARGIFELAIAQPVLDMPEVLWKAYIDFEITVKAHDRVRVLYDRLLDRTSHVKIYISRAQFEASIKEFKNARSIFENAHQDIKSSGKPKEERVLLLEAWRDFERNFGSEALVENVNKLLPKRVRKRRKIVLDDGSDGGWEEYYDYVFPEEANKQGANLKFLAMAKKWKRQKVSDDNHE